MFNNTIFSQIQNIYKNNLDQEIRFIFTIQIHLQLNQYKTYNISPLNVKTTRELSEPLLGISI